MFKLIQFILSISLLLYSDLAFSQDTPNGIVKVRLSNEGKGAAYRIGFFLKGDSRTVYVASDNTLLPYKKAEVQSLGLSQETMDIQKIEGIPLLVLKLAKALEGDGLVVDCSGIPDNEQHLRVWTYRLHKMDSTAFKSMSLVRRDLKTTSKNDGAAFRELFQFSIMPPHGAPMLRGGDRKLIGIYMLMIDENKSFPITMPIGGFCKRIALEHGADKRGEIK